MKCDWVGCTSSVIAEIWHPKEGSKVVDGGVKAYCPGHVLYGSEREALCIRIGYAIDRHRQVFLEQYFIEVIGPVNTGMPHAC